MEDNNLFFTQQISSLDKLSNSQVNYILHQAKEAMVEKGYDPTNQIVGYILSGDPTYITNHKGVRNLITKVERDILLEELVNSYLNKN